MTNTSISFQVHPASHRRQPYAPHFTDHIKRDHEPVELATVASRNVHLPK